MAKEMNRLLSIIAFVCLLMQPAAIAADNWAEENFARLKSLVGTWKGKDEDGQPASSTFEVTSGGTVVMEKLTPGDHPCMVTMYHIDGTRLMCTHYCASNNQPRMSADMYDAKNKILKFAFQDATNLPKAESGHMHSLAMKLPDGDHLEEDWEWKENDENRHGVFRFQRAK
jgi:hypothetical protein